jgi:hypothetical protein
METAAGENSWTEKAVGRFVRRAVLSVLVLGPALVARAEPAAQPDPPARPFDRYAVVVRAVNKPSGVPAAYIFTRNGFFHPSCVIKLRPDESIDADGVIRDLGGAVRERVEPCAYPSFDRAGRQMADAPASASHGFDGWLVDYYYLGNVTFDGQLNVSTDWLVPKAPTNVGQQEDIAFFNSVEGRWGNAHGIVQPVLEYHGPDKRWWVISEYCCVPMDVQSDRVDVRVGDVIRGTIAGTGCAAGTCQAWTITTTDLNSGKSTVLHHSGASKVLEIDPGVLETYGIATCDMLPANG